MSESMGRTATIFVEFDMSTWGSGFCLTGLLRRRLDFADTERIANLQIAVQQDLDPMRSFFLERDIDEGFDIGRRGF